MENIAPQNTQSVLYKANNWFKNSIMVKVLSIGFLILILMIPTSMIENIIYERQARSNEVVNEVSSKWGYNQTITGPMLTIPCNVWLTGQNGVPKAKLKYSYFLPENLQITGTVEPEIRYRGLYEVIVYNSKLNITGKFAKPSFEEWGIHDGHVKWDDVMISIGIPDMRGIQESIELKWNNEKFLFNPGIDNNLDLLSGVSTKVDMHITDSTLTHYEFSIQLDINGSGSLNFVPLGKETDVKISSSWETPSYMGAFLPDERGAREDSTGFSASWKILHLNRNFPQKWLNVAKNLNTASFGVRFLFPVDHYQKSIRTAKYANMFLFLTFLIFFFVEIINKKRIHPMQYLLVGFALSIFYSLLISLSEHFSFNKSFLIGSAAIVILITGYSHSIFKDLRLTALMGCVLTALYVLLFSILQMEDYSLLLGSLGIFLVLALVMFLSRKFKWYGEEEDQTITEESKAQ